MSEIVALMIPLVAIVGGFTVAIAKMAMQADERRQQIRLQLQQNGSETSKAIDELRAEVAHLREHGSQYDLSLDNTLQRLERRVEFLEGNIRSSARTTPQDTEAVQRVGQNL